MADSVRLQAAHCWCGRDDPIAELHISKSELKKAQTCGFEPPHFKLQNRNLSLESLRGLMCVKLYEGFVMCQAQFTTNYNIFVTEWLP
jgi:hypothetical protein